MKKIQVKLSIIKVTYYSLLLLTLNAPLLFTPLMMFLSAVRSLSFPNSLNRVNSLSNHVGLSSLAKPKLLKNLKINKPPNRMKILLKNKRPIQMIGLFQSNHHLILMRCLLEAVKKLKCLNIHKRVRHYSQPKNRQRQKPPQNLSEKILL